MSVENVQTGLKNENKLDDSLTLEYVSDVSEISTNLSPVSPSLSTTSLSCVLNPDDLIFNLKWSLRDLIVSNLSKFSSLLCGREISLEDKRCLVKLNNELILKLSNLSLENNEKKMKERLELIDENLVDEVEQSDGDLYLKIDWKLRDNIIFLLIKNYNFIILFDDCFSNETKSNLINENNDLVHRLLDLSLKPTDGNLKLNIKSYGSTSEGDKAIKAKENDFDEDSLAKNSKENQHYTDLKMRLYVLEKRIIDVDLNKSKEIRELNRRIDRVNTDSCTISFLIEKALDFLTYRKELKSETFYCSNLPWSILVRSLNKVKNSKFLEFFLQLEKIGSNDDRSVKILMDCEFRLLNPSSDNSVIRLFKNQMYTNERSVYGYPQFVDYCDLVRYIKNDSIKLECQLKVVKEIIRLENH